MSAEEEPVAGGFAQVLADTLVDAPADDVANDGPDVDDGDGTTDALQGEEGSETTEEVGRAAANREIHADNRRRLAANVLANRSGFPCLTMLFALALFVTTLFVYHDAVVTWIRHKDDPCDAPLATWLMVSIMIFPVQVVGAIVYRKLRVQRRPRRRRGERIPRPPWYVRVLGCVLRYWLCAVNPMFLVCGWVLSGQVEAGKTCDSELFRSVQEFMFYEMCIVSGAIAIVYCFAPTVLAAHRNDMATRQHNGHARVRRRPTATPGAIHRIETVPYSDDLFSSDDSDDGEEPPECCICQVEFDSSTAIKRTPCKHYFHESCLADWIMNYSKTCPLCRVDLDTAPAPEQPVQSA